MSELKKEHELFRRIESHLEAWADWDKMSEEEKEETRDDIYQIVKWAVSVNCQPIHPEQPKAKAP